MPRQAALATGLTAAGSLAAHAAFVALVERGVPCLNTLYPGTAVVGWCHIVRLLFYGATVLPLVALWRGVIPTGRPPLVSAMPIAVLVWMYWYILDPSLLLRRLAGSAWQSWLMEHTYGRPIIGELYWGWGFAKWHWHLAVGQAFLTVGCLAAMTTMMNRTKRNAAHEQEAAEQLVSGLLPQAERR